MGRPPPATQDTSYFFLLPTWEEGCYAHFPPKKPMATITELMVKSGQQTTLSPLSSLWSLDRALSQGSYHNQHPESIKTWNWRLLGTFSHTRTSISDFSKKLKGIFFLLQTPLSLSGQLLLILQNQVQAPQARSFLHTTLSRLTTLLSLLLALFSFVTQTHPRLWNNVPPCISQCKLLSSAPNKALTGLGQRLVPYLASQGSTCLTRYPGQGAASLGSMTSLKDKTMPPI